MARGFTDAELQQLATFFAMRYLEVERGLRDVRFLRRYMHPVAYLELQDPRTSRFGKGDMVGQADLGRMAFQRPVPGVAYVAVPARQEGDRWGALTMALRADSKGVWRITELARVQDRHLAADRQRRSRLPARNPVEAAAAWQCHIDAAQLAQMAAAGRRRDAQRLLAALAPERPARELQPGDLARPAGAGGTDWIEVREAGLAQAGDVRVVGRDGTELRLDADQRVSVLAISDDPEGSRQAADAASRQLAKAAAESAYWEQQVRWLESQGGDVRAVGPRDARSVERESPPEYLVRLLGPMPASGEARTVWHAAAETVEGYRQRWDIRATDAAIGPQVPHPAQATDRATTIDTLRQLSARLDQVTAISDEQATKRDLAQEVDTPAPFVLAAER